jgi:hypothetical protein
MLWSLYTTTYKMAPSKNHKFANSSTQTATGKENRWKKRYYGVTQRRCQFLEEEADETKNRALPRACGFISDSW